MGGNAQGLCTCNEEQAAAACMPSCKQVCTAARCQGVLGSLELCWLEDTFGDAMLTRMCFGGGADAAMAWVTTKYTLSLPILRGDGMLVHEPLHARALACKPRGWPHACGCARWWGHVPTVLSVLKNVFRLAQQPPQRCPRRPSPHPRYWQGVPGLRLSSIG